MRRLTAHNGVARAPMPAIAPPTTQPIGQSKPTLAASPKVLIVDDAAGTARSLAPMIRRCGCSVRLVQGGAAATQALKDRLPQLVILGLGHEDEGSVSFASLLARQAPELPLIAVLGRPTVSGVLEARSLGAIGVLCQPVPPDSVQPLLKRALEEGRVRTSARLAEEHLRRSRTWEERIEGQFSRALKTAHVAFQPIVRLRTGKVEATEALLRAPELGEDGAMPLLQLAARLQRLPELDQQVREATARVLELEPDLPLTFVNARLDRTDIMELGRTQDPLHSYADRVCIDLPTSFFAQPAPYLRQETFRLQRVGFRLSGDDLTASVFAPDNAGNPSPDFVRLSMREARHATQGGARAGFLRALVALAHDVGAQVIATAVETCGEEDLARRLDCDLAQGFLYGPAALPEGALGRACLLGPMRNDLGGQA